jgi:hypothetical protein
MSAMRCEACGAEHPVPVVVSVSRIVTTDERKALTDAGYIVVSSERGYPSIRIEYPPTQEPK